MIVPVREEPLARRVALDSYLIDPQVCASCGESTHRSLHGECQRDERGRLLVVEGADTRIRGKERVVSERKCAYCPKWFTPKRSAARYCSDACRSASWKERRSRTPRTRSRASGLQVGYQKGAKVAGAEMARRLNLHEETCIAFLLEALAMALPERQRERLGSSTVGERKAA